MRRHQLIVDFLRSGARHVYGPQHHQYAELFLPAREAPHPVVVAIHGGSWGRRYGKLVMRGLCADLRRSGFAVWNIEYRRGHAGGWPATFLDVAAAIDALGDLGRDDLDLADVTLLGHSAGGQLALWAASRANLPDGTPGAAPRIQPQRTIGMAAVCDMAAAWTGAPPDGGAVGRFMGGGPQAVPDHYAHGDPIALVPASGEVLLVHGTQDATVSVKRSRDYAARAGAATTLVEIEGAAGAHREHVDPRGEAWATARAWLRERSGDQ